MKVRECLLDQARKAAVIDITGKSWNGLEGIHPNCLVQEGVGMANFNYRSTKDLATLFYADELGISPIIAKEAAQLWIEAPERSKST